MLPVAVCLLLLTGGCESLGFVNSDDDGPPRRERVTHDSLGTGTIPADVLDEGSHGAIQEETKKVLRSEEAYASFWQTLHANRRSAPERPSVDFDRAVVVAIAIGQRPSGGYGVHIDTVRALPNSAPVQVTFTEGKPGEDCLVSTVITSPYVLATVETDRDFVFEKSTVTGSCK
jgi:hypothetical protein